MAGPSLYSVASKVYSPEDPCIKSYEDLIVLLKKYLEPTVNVVAERYKFRQCEQSGSQSISEFIIQLKAESHRCNLAAFLPEALRDQFVAGVGDVKLRTKLFGEFDLTFEKACTVACSHEPAEQESKVMKGTSKIATLGEQSHQKPCHNPETCPAKQWTYYVCGKSGHISTMCKSSESYQESTNSQSRVAEMSEAVNDWRLNLMSKVVEE
ncbi:uncharacterized protein LOC128739971 [Sabethes cyaneus]|uniref:uncharacterized protein LOC128739971 n=1 Tax=Sabethes cyaneus TaxID=53552 RepID=UPI00237E958E|nr:uncharacterized protein LOC128739971 [Sabethes cyaneus]